ncbi:MAG: hypothetical protein WCI25_05875, partial [Actinomycetes bacterium]
PLSSLDSRLKSDLRRLLRAIHRKGQTILHVTHDYEEALSLGTKIAVIHQGKIIQSGSPAEVFHHPKSEFVAHFIGVKNFFPVKLVTENNVTFAHTGNNIPVRLVTDNPDGEGFILIRGEDILLSSGPVETSATNNLSGTVVEIVPTKAGVDVTVDAGIEIHAKPGEEIAKGSPLFTLHTETPERFPHALEALQGGWSIGEQASATLPLIVDRITA